MSSIIRRQISAIGALAILAASVPAIAGGAREQRDARRVGITARVVGTFVMRGRITSAVRVRGERPGQLVTRRWLFVGVGCNSSTCLRLRLRRQRSAGKYSRLTLNEFGAGRYTGTGRFFVGLRCRGRIHRLGEVVPYRITVTVTQDTLIEGIPFASRLSATYAGSDRRDDTICPIGPSFDAARYSGIASPLASPPTASFSAAVAPGNDTATFRDTSESGAGLARLVSVRWDFGDPGSGASDVATAIDPTHHFTAPGVYQVTLVVTDVNDLTSTVTVPVTVPAPSDQAANRRVARTAASSPMSRPALVRPGETTA